MNTHRPPSGEPEEEEYKLMAELEQLESLKEEMEELGVTTLAEGTILTVIDKPPDLNVPYPVQQDGFVWWRVQQDDGTVGWVAENWLRAVAP